MPTKQPPYVASFDSAAGMLRALSEFLHGRDFPGVGIASPRLKWPAMLLNRSPRWEREFAYRWTGWLGAIRPSALGGVRAEEMSEWTTGLYPARKYQAVAVGSASGALVHLCAALGIPWLPQTFLIPVRRHGVDPDEPADDLRWANGPAFDLLERNPQLQLHHMHDANQDRLMIQHMTYFRVKRLWLGRAYERFIEQSLEPGGTILLSECNLRWRTIRVRDRHVFQHGAPGGATPDEFQHGGDRVADYLERYGSPHRRWEAPEPDGLRPEAEWGFEAALRDDVERFARRRGYRVRRVLFDEPQFLSPLVADLYRWWYARRGMPSRRLLVESFVLMEPWWALRTGSVPFWMLFNKEPSATAVERYIEHAGPLDEIYMMLFSHGVDSVGLVPIERWRALLSRAAKRGAFVGVDERAYPRDWATFVRYNRDLPGVIPARYPMPGYLTLPQLDEFLATSAGTYPVEWVENGERPFGPAAHVADAPTATALERHPS